MISLVKRHPIITFFVLAYALSWWGVILYTINHDLPPVASFGPFLAALVVLAITHGKAGVLGLLKRMVRWRVGPAWYAAAFGLPVAITLCATVLNVLLGAQAPSAAELGGWSGLLPTFFILLLIPGFGGAWEEPGWRGYALPQLQTGRSALFASLILGVLIAGWHLPLMVVGQVHYSDIVTIMGAVVVFNWVFNNANGSVLIIMLMHATNNAATRSRVGARGLRRPDPVRHAQDARKVVIRASATEGTSWLVSPANRLRQRGLPRDRRYGREHREHKEADRRNGHFPGGVPVRARR
jgi:membrane protease YdiL (CAAX protease family)